MLSILKSTPSKDLPALLPAPLVFLPPEGGFHGQVEGSSCNGKFRGFLCGWLLSVPTLSAAIDSRCVFEVVETLALFCSATTACSALLILLVSVVLATG